MKYVFQISTPRKKVEKFSIHTTFERKYSLVSILRPSPLTLEYTYYGFVFMLLQSFASAFSPARTWTDLGNPLFTYHHHRWWLYQYHFFVIIKTWVLIWHKFYVFWKKKYWATAAAVIMDLWCINIHQCHFRSCHQPLIDLSTVDRLWRKSGKKEESKRPARPAWFMVVDVTTKYQIQMSSPLRLKKRQRF